MAQTISQAQRSAISEGFLDNLGSSRDSDGLKTDHIVDALGEIAGILLDETNKNLDKGGHNSSGALASSFTVVDPTVRGKVLSLDIEALQYYQFLNNGVKGTKSGNGRYAFKNPYPSKKMVKEIGDWMKRAGMSTRNIKKSVSKQESKQSSVAQLNAAYAVARSIKQKGIKGTGFFDKAVQTANQKTKEILGKALKIDIINSLPTNLNGTNT